MTANGKGKSYSRRNDCADHLKAKHEGFDQRTDAYARAEEGRRIID